jgi:hypothetical protein
MKIKIFLLKILIDYCITVYICAQYIGTIRRIIIVNLRTTILKQNVHIFAYYIHKKMCNITLITK